MLMGATHTFSPCFSGSAESKAINLLANLLLCCANSVCCTWLYASGMGFRSTSFPPPFPLSSVQLAIDTNSAEMANIEIIFFIIA